MLRSDTSVSWPDEFLGGLTTLPPSKTTFSLTPVTDSKLLEGTYKIRKALVWDKKHPISVWHATANGRNYVIKEVIGAQHSSNKVLMCDFSSVHQVMAISEKLSGHIRRPSLIPQQLSSRSGRILIRSYWSNEHMIEFIHLLQKQARHSSHYITGVFME